ncbi:MAG TPA: class I SAM-dependent RNA methyltransferase [Pyrinomonadaceae bacterium]|nr:class I SAM-dependent RNA methyltransferase [Pyrinomonadaceae bacterium]
MKRKQHRPRRETPQAEGKLRVGASVEVEIERIVPGGAGLAHADGYTLFVTLAAPGDRVRARIERVRGKVAFASLAEIIKPSPVRIEPPCPYFGRCGGCDFQQLTYEAQLAAKTEIIRDCLRRIARYEAPAHIPITPSPAIWRYRSRARWQHDPARRLLGYYELASHRVCDVVECPVVLPEVQDKLSHLRATLLTNEPGATTNMHAAGETKDTREFNDPEEFQAVAGDDGVSLLPPLAEEDAHERTRTLAGERYRFDASCFFQINHALLEPLLAEALKDAAGETALDLYCGVGLFTLPLARRFARVNAVEGNASATHFARLNLDAARLTNATVHTARVGDWLAANASTLAPLDFLLLDPPRSGAEPETLDAMLALRPRRISYVSCDPATLARDLRPLFEAAYTLDSLHAFDMFPQTHHVETVVRLTATHVS